MNNETNDKVRNELNETKSALRDRILDIVKRCDRALESGSELSIQRVAETIAKRESHELVSLLARIHAFEDLES